MNSHMVGVTTWLYASPLAEGERIEVMGSMPGIRSQNPHPTLSFALIGAGASVSPSGREKRERRMSP
jgi:hypothetical protein